MLGTYCGQAAFNHTWKMGLTSSWLLDDDQIPHRCFFVFAHIRLVQGTTRDRTLRLRLQGGLLYNQPLYYTLVKKQNVYQLCQVCLANARVFRMIETRHTLPSRDASWLLPFARICYAMVQGTVAEGRTRVFCRLEVKRESTVQ